MVKIDKDDRDAEQEERTKRRRQEEEDHRTAKSSGHQQAAEMEKKDEIQDDHAAVEQHRPEEQLTHGRGEKRKAEDEIDRETDPGMDIDRMEEKSDAELRNFLGRKITELGAELQSVNP